MRKVFSLLIFLISIPAFAQNSSGTPESVNSTESSFKIYKSTNNTGLNRIERLEHIETYLTGLSQTLVRLESKIQVNTESLDKIEKSINIFKTQEVQTMVRAIVGENQTKASDSAEGDKKFQDEIDLLKADILKLKNSDIQNLSTEIQGISGVVRNLETILKASANK